MRLGLDNPDVMIQYARIGFCRTPGTAQLLVPSLIGVEASLVARQLVKRSGRGSFVLDVPFSRNLVFHVFRLLPRKIRDPLLRWARSLLEKMLRNRPR
jgi:hypothetical protein